MSTIIKKTTSLVDSHLTSLGLKVAEDLGFVDQNEAPLSENLTNEACATSSAHRPNYPSMTKEEISKSFLVS